MVSARRAAVHCQRVEGPRSPRARSGRVEPVARAADGADAAAAERPVYWHALHSALTPLVTQLGIDVGTLLGGAIVTETVFGLPGLGQLAVQSITTQDLPVIVVIANIAVDLLDAVLDPRVRVN